jgi:subtilisin family serine protease
MCNYLKLFIFLWCILSGNSLFAESVVSGSVTPLEGCAPLVVRLEADQSNDIENYWWEIDNDATEKAPDKAVFGAISEISLNMPSTYVVSLYVIDKENNSTISQIETVTVKAADNCEEPPPPSESSEPLEACFNLTVLEKTFGMGDIWAVNKKPDEGLKVELDASCSIGNDIVDYTWNASNGKRSSGSHSQMFFDKAGTYNIALAVADVSGKIAEKSKQMTIGELCAEFELPDEINFNEKSSFLLRIDTCEPVFSNSPINFQWEIISSDAECEKVKPIIEDNHITFIEPPIEKKCGYEIILTATDNNGLAVSTSQVTKLQGAFNTVYFEAFKNGEKQSINESEWVYHPEDTFKLEVVINFQEPLDNCGSFADLFIAVEIDNLPNILNCINPKMFLTFNEPFYSIDDKDCDSLFFPPLYTEGYPKPYSRTVESDFFNIWRNVVIRALPLKAARGKYTFYSWLVKEGTDPFDFEPCGDFRQPYKRTINVDRYDSDNTKSSIDLPKKPIAKPKVSMTSKCDESLEVRLNGSGSYSTEPNGNIIQYTWTIMDSDMTSPEPTDEAVTHMIFDKEGDYTLNLVVTDNNEVDSEPTEISISVEKNLSISPCRHEFLSEQSEQFFLTPSDEKSVGGLTRNIKKIDNQKLEMKEPVVCAVIDSGVDYNHSALQSYMWKNPDEVPDNGIDDDDNGCIDDIYGCDFTEEEENGKYFGDPMDECGHGTHIAGVLTGLTDHSIEAEKNINFQGIETPIQIMPLKVAANRVTYSGIECGDVKTESLIAALKYATQMDIQCIYIGVHSVPNSDKETLEEVIQDLALNNTIMIASAGNRSQNNDSIPHYPASFIPELDNIISVCSTDNNTLSPFSNFGANSVDLCALGEGIYSTYTQNSYGTDSGTSIAASYVARAVALLKSAYPKLTASEIKNHLMASAKRRSALTETNVTGGYLDFYNAINTLKLRQQTFTVSNLTETEVLINEVTLAGTNEDEFEIRVDDCSSKELVHKEQCDIQTFFTPTSTGKKNALLKVRSGTFTAVATLNSAIINDVPSDDNNEYNGGVDSSDRTVNTDVAEPARFDPDEGQLDISTLALENARGMVDVFWLNLYQIEDKPLTFRSKLQCDEDCQFENDDPLTAQLKLQCNEYCQFGYVKTRLKKLGDAIYKPTSDADNPNIIGTLLIHRVQVGTDRRFYEFNLNVMISSEGYIDFELDGDAIPIH